jgi:hypothetical protein
MTRQVGETGVFVSTESASAAIELLTSGLRGQEKRFARSCLVAGLAVSYRRQGSDNLPVWLRCLVVDLKAPSLAEIVAELRLAATETSYRQLGRETGLNARTIQLIVEEGATPRRTSEAKLRRWVVRRNSEMQPCGPRVCEGQADRRGAPREH